MISALPFAIKRIIQDEIYCIYITDALKTISENTAALSGGSHVSKRFYDILHPTKAEIDNRTGDEIANDVIASICGGDGG